MIRSVVVLSPEAPYPLHGGGAYRTASLIHYFAWFADVDLILIREGHEPAPTPPGLLRSQSVISLPRHGRGAMARYARNAVRAIRGIPPLLDRLSRQSDSIRAAFAGRSWDLGIVEHFWCAPYIQEVRQVCRTAVLDLHNVESVLHARSAAVESGVVAAGHRRFAQLYRRRESELLPQYSLVLVPSGTDAAAVRAIAPSTRLAVYPNSLPPVECPDVTEERRVVFSGNFEYHPNIDAAAFLISEIWPRVRGAHPEIWLRFVGRGHESIRRFARHDSMIEFTGPVDDALTEIAAARAVVAPLRAGSGTRIKILEAWAAKRAVVATSIAAEGLEAEDGVNLLIADTAAAFAQKIGRVLEDASLRERLGTAGRQTFDGRYTWQAAWRSLDSGLQTATTEELNLYTE